MSKQYSVELVESDIQDDESITYDVVVMEEETE